MNAGDNGENYPPWADALGWLMTLCVIVSIFATAIYQVVITPGSLGEVSYSA